MIVVVTVPLSARNETPSIGPSTARPASPASRNRLRSFELCVAATSVRTHVGSQIEGSDVVTQSGDCAEAAGCLTCLDLQRCAERSLRRRCRQRHRRPGGVVARYRRCEQESAVVAHFRRRLSRRASGSALINLAASRRLPESPRVWRSSFECSGARCLGTWWSRVAVSLLEIARQMSRSTSA